MRSASVIVIGAGVSGLAAALALKKRGLDVIVLEAEPRVGGVVRTYRQDGFLCEAGPNTLMLSKGEVADFLAETGLLASALDAAPLAKKRFVVQNGKLVALPGSPLSFIASSVLPWKAKAWILREPFVPPGKENDETLADFVRRRLGEDFLRELVGPFVSGVYAGDPERLVTRHALPKLFHLEQTHGSLIRGAIRLRRGEAGPRGRLISWPGGLSELGSNLADCLEGRLRLSTSVSEIKKRDRSFVLRSGNEEFQADKVILAVDAASAARLIAPMFPDVSPLESIPYASMSVVHLGFSRAMIGHPLDGFGALISRARGIRTLGALFSSTLFPGRAPDGHALLTVFIGGRLDPEAISLDDKALIQTALNDLGPLLQISGAPVFHKIVRWPQAIPQYEKDHSLILKTCEAVETALPGLRLIGNYRRGIAMENCLANGIAAGNAPL